MYIIVVYDVVQEGNGQRIWRNLFKLCKKYLNHVQNSVFEGEVSKSQLFELEKSIDKIIRKDKDSVIIFQSRHERWLNKTILGIPIDTTDVFV